MSAACFTDFGGVATCIDKDAGETSIFEPGLEQLVADNVREGRLSFTTDATDASRSADAVFIAAGTPPSGGATS